MQLTSTSCCNIVELRQYQLHPGQRDTLITIFDREFVETQEALGMTLLGQFRDIDRPDVFTWLRGFPDMESRAASLGSFYDGPVWAKSRNEANATMVAWDNVRLLRPVLAWPLGDRPAPGATAVPTTDRGIVVGTIYPLKPRGPSSFSELFEGSVAPRLAAAGAHPFATFETEPGVNSYPRLPVREGERERCFAWFARFADVAAYERSITRLGEDVMWRSEVIGRLDAHLAAPVEVLRLEPTARSRTLP